MWQSRRWRPLVDCWYYYFYYWYSHSCYSDGWQYYLIYYCPDPLPVKQTSNKIVQCLLYTRHWPDTREFITRTVELWNRWIRLLCYYNRVYSISIKCTWEESMEISSGPFILCESSDGVSAMRIFFILRYCKLSSSRTASLVRCMRSSITLFSSSHLPTNGCYKDIQGTNI